MKEVSRVDSLVGRLTLMSFFHCSLSLSPSPSLSLSLSLSPPFPPLSSGTRTGQTSQGPHGRNVPPVIGGERREDQCPSNTGTSNGLAF